MDLCVAYDKGLIVLEMLIVHGADGNLQMKSGTEMILHHMTDIILGCRKREWFICSCNRGIIDFMILMKHDNNTRILDGEYKFLLFFLDFMSSSCLEPETTGERIILPLIP